LNVQSECLKDITEETGWDDLQIEEEYKETLRSLVERHFTNKNHVEIEDDLIMGKGDQRTAILIYQIH